MAREYRIIFASASPIWGILLTKNITVLLTDNNYHTKQPSATGLMTAASRFERQPGCSLAAFALKTGISAI